MTAEKTPTLPFEGVPPRGDRPGIFVTTRAIASHELTELLSLSGSSAAYFFVDGEWKPYVATELYAVNAGFPAEVSEGVPMVTWSGANEVPAMVPFVETGVHPLRESEAGWMRFDGVPVLRVRLASEFADSQGLASLVRAVADDQLAQLTRISIGSADSTHELFADDAPLVQRLAELGVVIAPSDSWEELEERRRRQRDEQREQAAVGGMTTGSGPGPDLEVVSFVAVAYVTGRLLVRLARDIFSSGLIVDARDERELRVIESRSVPHGKIAMVFRDHSELLDATDKSVSDALRSLLSGDDSDG